VGVEPDGTFAPTVRAQARRALVIILAAIEALGAKAYDVVRTRIYLTDIHALEGGGRGSTARSSSRSGQRPRSSRSLA